MDLFDAAADLEEFEEFEEYELDQDELDGDLEEVFPDDLDDDDDDEEDDDDDEWSLGGPEELGGQDRVV